MRAGGRLYLLTKEKKLAKEINKKVYSSLYPKLAKAWIKLKCHNYQRPGMRLFQPMRRINKLGRQLKSSKMNLLDIGCFNGVLSCVASRHFRKVIGIDIWKDRIDSAIETRKIFHVKNCVFRFIQFRNYIKSGMFDQDEIKAILATQVLYHLTTTEIDLMKEKLGSSDIKAVIFGTRPNKDYTNNAYDLREVGDVVRHLIKPFFQHHNVYYQEEHDWPIIVATKHDV